MFNSVDHKCDCSVKAIDGCSVVTNYAATAAAAGPLLVCSRRETSTCRTCLTCAAVHGKCGAVEISACWHLSQEAAGAACLVLRGVGLWCSACSHTIVLHAQCLVFCDVTGGRWRCLSCVAWRGALVLELLDSRPRLLRIACLAQVHYCVDIAGGRWRCLFRVAWRGTLVLDCAANQDIHCLLSAWCHC
jgi:hypothetical protein